MHAECLSLRGTWRLVMSQVADSIPDKFAQPHLPNYKRFDHVLQLILRQVKQTTKQAHYCVNVRETEHEHVNINSINQLITFAFDENAFQQYKSIIR